MKRFIYYSILCLMSATCAFSSQDDSNSLKGKVCSSSECYTILEELGEGAFGKVFAVQDSKGQKFAIKSYDDDVEWSDSLLGDAKREFQRGQQLDHPNIIKSFELFTYQNPEGVSTNNLVLQLVEGKTVSATKKGALSGQAAIQAAFQLSNALNYALSLGLFHLDLHQGNVMLTNQHDVMVVDLASFFSFDEILRFANQQEDPESSELSIGDFDSDNAYSSSFEPLSVPRPSVAPLGPLQIQKIKRFLAEHPGMSEQLHQAKQATQKNSSTGFGKLGSSADQMDEAEHQKLIVYVYYFDMMTEMCVDILSRSDLSSEEKIGMRVKIKTLAWTYSEDFAKQRGGSFDEYLNKLYEVLLSN